MTGISAPFNLVSCRRSFLAASLALAVILMGPACSDTTDSGEATEGTVVDSGRGRGNIDTTTNDTTQDRSVGEDDLGSGDVAPQPDAVVTEDTVAQPDQSGCENQGFFLKPDDSQLANVMLVVDRSNSMNDGTRWIDMGTALRGVTRPLETVVAFGLLLFPDPSGGLMGVCDTGRVTVPTGLLSATDISNSIGTSPPSGGTPTAASLYAARTELLAENPAGPNYVLLATDGGPGCNSALDLSTCTCIPGAVCSTVDNCLDDVRTLEAVEALYADDIPTFVVGVPGSETVSDLLDQMAIAGGTDIDGHHYAVTGGTELAEALRATTGGLVPCDYEFDTPPTDIDSLSVTIDGSEIPRDVTGEEGWDFVDNVLHLYGTACTRIRDGASHAVDASYDCSE